MTNRGKYYLAKTVKLCLMWVVPVVAAAIIWGFIKEPENNTFMGRLGLGAFIALFLAILFFKDYISNELEKIRIQEKTTFVRNHTFTFGVIGLIFTGAYFIAYDAAIFCGIGFASHAIAFLIQLLERRYYKLWKG